MLESSSNVLHCMSSQYFDTFFKRLQLAKTFCILMLYDLFEVLKLIFLFENLQCKIDKKVMLGAGFETHEPLRISS